MGSPDFANVLEGREASQSLQSATEVVGSDEVSEVLAELLVALVIEALDRGFLDGPVHSFDLAIRPGVLRFGQPMVDVILRAGEFKGVGTEEFSCRHGLLDLKDGRAAGTRRRELDAIVGEHCMNFVGHCRDKTAKEIAGNFRRSL